MESGGRFRVSFTSASHANSPYFYFAAEGCTGAFLAGHLSGLKRCATVVCRNPPTRLIRYVTVFCRGLVTTIPDREIHLPPAPSPSSVLFRYTPTPRPRLERVFARSLHLPSHLLTIFMSFPCRLFSYNYNLPTFCHLADFFYFSYYEYFFVCFYFNLKSYQTKNLIKSSDKFQNKNTEPRWIKCYYYYWSSSELKNK